MTQTDRLQKYLREHPGATCGVCGVEFASFGKRGRHERLAHPDWRPDPAFRAQRKEESRARYAARQSRSVVFLRHANKNARALGRPVVDVMMSLSDGPCVYCGAPSETWDHVIPVSKGGETSSDNLAPSCHACNRRKSRYGVETALFKGSYLCGWCWAPIHRRRSSAERTARNIKWFACSPSHANILRRWGGLAFGDPGFAGPRTRLVAA